LIIEDESQNANTHATLQNRGDPVAMQAGRGKVPMQNIRGQYKGKKPFLKCDYCNKPGHSKENCYKLVGYPTDFKAKRSYAANMTTGGQESGKQAGQDEEGSRCDGLKIGSYFTEDQYGQILSMLNREAPEHQANMAGIATSLMESFTCKEWFNLISVSKLTRQLCCSVNFFPYFCLFQDLYNGKVRGIGRERGGLYILKKNFKGDLERFAPYELLHNRAPSLTHLRVLGCLCYATNLVKEDKFSPRAIVAVFLGYAETQKGYKLIDLNTNKFFVCRDVIFKENMFPF
ncbi:hypothetical protein A4A49_65857, partial [Nicotiana attenuata]